MSDPIVIGLAGVARSGKDTVGKILVDKHGFTRVAFADALREMALAIDPFVTVSKGGEGVPLRLSEVINALGWDRAKTEILEVRRLLQAIGTEAVRNIVGVDTWVRIAARQILSDPTKKYVITDCRFDNEAEMIHTLLHGQLWQVQRPGVEPLNAHASEAGIDLRHVSRTLVNDKTLEDLEKAVTEVLKDL